MIPCINQATVLTSDTMAFLKSAREHSFSHVELDIGKVEECLKQQSMGALKKEIGAQGLSVVSLNAIENYPIITDSEFSESLKRCGHVLDLARRLDCRIVVANPSEFTPANRGVVSQRFDALVREVEKMTKDYGVRLGFEYVSYDNRVVNSLAKTIEKLREWKSGVGLVLDFFHLYKSSESVASIPKEFQDSLWVFHVNDAPSMPLSELEDSDRVFPLEGVAHPELAVQELSEIGFKGPVSVELFNQTYWSKDLDSVMSIAQSSLDRLIGK